VFNGIDARLVDAEAAFRAGNPTQMMTILNTLRATQFTIGTMTTPVLPALTDPGAAGHLKLLFREKAFWTFSRGQRLGDMRRLIRYYGLPSNQVFPEGVHYRGGNYGTDINLPVPQEEQNNPKATTGCIDRNA
jgi:hypothetical protein